MYNPKRYIVIVTIVLIAILSLNLIVLAEPTVIDGNFHVTINGEVVEFSDELGKPQLIKETQRTIVPLRIIAENMGYNVTWDQKLKKATVIGNGTTVELIIGKNTAFVNGKVVPIDMKDGKPVNTQSMLLPAKGSLRTYVPLRFIAEITGAEITHDMKNGVHHIEINTGKEVKPIESKPDTSGIIEPKFKVYPRNGSTHFEIYLENFMDYKGTDATFSLELISHPHYHKYKGKDLFVPGKWVEVNQLDTLSNKKPNYNKPLFSVYSFIMSEHNIDIKTNKPHILPKKGEIMTVQFTVKMNGESKAFLLDVPFPK